MGARMQGLARLHRKLGLLTERERAAVGDAVEGSVKAIEADAVRRVGGDFEVLHEISEDRLSARVGSNDFTSLFREFGTAPHAIKPKNRKALAFQGDAGKVVAGRVLHPGQREQPFLTPAVEAERPNLARNVARALNAAHRKVASR